jgi:hypothetical protein
LLSKGRTWKEGWREGGTERRKEGRWRRKVAKEGGEGRKERWRRKVVKVGREKNEGRKALRRGCEKG